MGEHRNERSHFYKHYRETRAHRFRFEDVQALATEKMEHPRKFLEGIYSKINKNTINRAAMPTYYQSIVGAYQLEDNDS